MTLYIFLSGHTPGSNRSIIASGKYVKWLARTIDKERPH
jgi:hypothetical protein